MNKKARIISLILVLFLLGLEGGMRWVQGRLSNDAKHYDQMPAIVERLNKTSDEKIVFIGNSLTRHGIDLKTLIKNIPDTQIALVHPDDTTIMEWYWVFENLVSERVKELNMLVVPFGPGQLEDRKLNGDNLTRIANISETVQLFDVRETEMLGLGQTTEMFLAEFSVVFGSREKVQRKILRLLPHYRETIQAINSRLKEKKGHEVRKKTYHQLQRLLRQNHYPGLQILLVAVPIPQYYSLDQKIMRLVAEHENVALFDARRLMGIKKESFLDGYHLNGSGAQIFTSAVANRLVAGQFNGVD